MTKQERVWKLVEDVGEETATAIQQIEDAEKLEDMERFFKQEVIGRKSSYRDE